MAHRQQVAVFGVEQEQQAVEQNECRIAYRAWPSRIGTLRFGIRPRERVEQRWEHIVEYRARQIGGDLLAPFPREVQRRLKETTSVWARHETVAPKQQDEGGECLRRIRFQKSR
jgi:hypothetical protein